MAGPQCSGTTEYRGEQLRVDTDLLEKPFGCASYPLSNPALQVRALSQENRQLMDGFLARRQMFLPLAIRCEVEFAEPLMLQLLRQHHEHELAGGTLRQER